MSSVMIARLAASHTYPLRSAVLRTGLPIETCMFDGDDAPNTYHYGAFVDSFAGGCRLVGIVSLYRFAEATTGGWSWQLRAMATHPQHREQGIGRRLVELLLARHAGTEHIWCNAREHAIGFYEKLQFVTEGRPFDIPGVGMHQTMRFSPNGQAGTQG